jgi:hypothetical protein
MLIVFAMAVITAKPDANQRKYISQVTDMMLLPVVPSR